MRKIIILLIILLQNSIVSSQDYFSNRYYYESYNSWDAADKILELDSNYIVVGATGDEFMYTWHRVGLLKVSRDGIFLSSKSIGDTISEYYIQYPGSFKQTSENNFFAVGVRRQYTADWVFDAGMIYFFNSNLDTIWTKSTYDNLAPIDTSYIFNNLYLSDDNEIYIIGNINISGQRSEVIVLKTDSLGNEQWRKYYSSGSINRGYNILQTPDVGFALSAYKWTFGLNGISSPYVIKTDSAGNEQWRWYAMNGMPGKRHGPMYLVNSPDSTVIGVYSYSDSADYPGTDTWNRDAVVKLDLEGNVLWEKKYAPSIYYNNWISSAAITGEGKVIASGYKYSPFSHRVGYLFCFSNDGDSLWSREYELLQEYESLNYLYGVIPTSDGGYAAAGRVIPYPPDTGNQDVWVLKVDSLGCESQEDCWVGEPEILTLNETGSILIYPNPASTQVTIALPKENEEYVITIYNIFGIKASETKIPKAGLGITLNIENWRTGLYMVSLVCRGNIVATGRFIKQ